MDLVPQLSGIFVVFALLAFTLWFLKKKGAIRMAALLPFRRSARRPRGNEKLLERIDALQLSATHSLSLIRMADRAILIGISPGGFCLVESSPWKSPQNDDARQLVEQHPAGQSFGSREQVQR